MVAEFHLLIHSSNTSKNPWLASAEVGSPWYNVACPVAWDLFCSVPQNVVENWIKTRISEVRTVSVMGWRHAKLWFHSLCKMDGSPPLFITALFSFPIIIVVYFFLRNNVYIDGKFLCSHVIEHMVLSIITRSYSISYSILSLENRNIHTKEKYNYCVTSFLLPFMYISFSLQFYIFQLIPEVCSFTCYLFT